MARERVRSQYWSSPSSSVISSISATGEREEPYRTVELTRLGAPPTIFPHQMTDRYQSLSPLSRPFSSIAVLSSPSAVLCQGNNFSD